MLLKQYKLKLNKLLILYDKTKDNSLLYKINILSDIIYLYIKMR